jgi:hypothetical protein
MSLIDMGVKNLKAIGFGAALPAERDQLFNAITGDATKAQNARISGLEASLAEKKKKEAMGMKKGGKVKSIDGIALRGKTRAK